MILDETQVRDMLSVTLLRPLMWAATREGYAARLSTLLDVLGYHGSAIYDVLPHAGSALLDPGVPLDDEWAGILAKRVQLILDVAIKPEESVGST